MDGDNIAKCDINFNKEKNAHCGMYLLTKKDDGSFLGKQNLVDAFREESQKRVRITDAHFYTLAE